MKTTVVNMRTHKPTNRDVYIGRGSRWGNPFKIGQHGTREEVIAKYRRRLFKAIKADHVSLEELAFLYGKNLVCYCAPQPCHGDVLAAAAQWAFEALEKQQQAA